MSSNAAETSSRSALLANARRAVAAWLYLARYATVLPFHPTLDRLRRAVLTREMLASRLPLVRLETLVGQSIPDATPIAIKAVAQHQANCSIFELLAIRLVATLVHPGRIFEIGTYDGRSSLALAGALAPGGEVITLNLPPDYVAHKTPADVTVDEELSAAVESGWRWRGTEEAGRIRQVFGNSMEFDFTPYAPCQMVFIDGGHSEEVSGADTQNALKIIDRQNGAILWHDATRYGVRPMLERLRARGHRVYLLAGTSLGILRFLGGSEVDLAY